MIRRFVLATALASVSSIALAQSDEADEEAEAGQEIVVTGQKPRGSVIGDIPPENILTTRDIRATGATSIAELLDAVAPQTGSARGRGGGMPVVLLNGQRTSGFRDLRDLPPEAIERMEILPEEVALKYGYAADQRVVNIVLRRRFNSTSAELRGRTSTQAGTSNGQVDATRLIIADGKRTSLNFHAEGSSPLYESERAILLDPLPSQPVQVDPRPFRTLKGASSDMRLTATANRSISDVVSGTFTAEAERTTGSSSFGVSTGTLTVGEDQILRAFPEAGALTRRSSTNAVRLGSAINGSLGKWRWSSTGNAELSRSETRSDRGFDLSPIQGRIDAGDPTVDPLGALAGISRFDPDRARSTTTSLGLDATATGPLFSLPAGDASVTLKVAASASGQDSVGTRQGLPNRSNLSRGIGEWSASMDLPLAKRSASIGRLTANLNVGARYLTDFSWLTSLGAGLNWTPAPRVGVIASWTREEGAPSIGQLGDALLETPGVRFFDYTRNETVAVTTLTGGNPDLRADRRNVFKFGGNWQPAEKVDLRLRADFVHERIDRPQASFPAASAALEQAFPGRFVRDADGTLVRVDLRPVNFDQSRRTTLRLGVDFTKPLKTAPPSQETIASLREQFQRQAARDGIQLPPRPPEGEGSRAGGGGRGFGGGGGFGRFGGGNGGRLTFSLTDTLTFQDEVTIARGLPKLDYLNGDASGSQGGTPRHKVEAQAGYYNNGIGARLSANWRSGTTVRGASGDLDFSPYATFDLRLFANLGELLDLVAKHPILRGTSVRLEVANLFDTKPQVRDLLGRTPVNYQPDLLEPTGRMIGISIRKLFIPRQFFRQGGFGGNRGGPRPDGPPPADAPPPPDAGGAGPPPPRPGS